jgi:hypothetical protein
MARWEQFEVWVLHGAKWSMVAAFNDFELASTVSRNRTERMRLIHTVYENGKVVEQDILAELGMVRTGS